MHFVEELQELPGFAAFAVFDIGLAPATVGLVVAIAAIVLVVGYADDALLAAGNRTFLLVGFG